MIQIRIFEKKMADWPLLIVLARLPYNKPAYLSINLDTVRVCVPQDTQTPSSPFLSPAWLLSRRKRRGSSGGLGAGVSLAEDDTPNRCQFSIVLGNRPFYPFTSQPSLHRTSYPLFSSSSSFLQPSRNLRFTRNEMMNRMISIS